MPVEQMLAKRPKAIILSGGPKSVYSPGAPGIDASLFSAGVPTFGICYGHQVMASALGGTVAKTGTGRVRLHPAAGRRPRGALLRAADRAAGLDEPRRLRGRGAAWLRGHGGDRHDAGRRLRGPEPAGSTASSSTPRSCTASRGSRCCAGSSRPPAAGRTGRCSTSSTTRWRRSAARSATSAPSAACPAASTRPWRRRWSRRAIGDKLSCVFVDHGLLRKGEAEQVEHDFVASTGVELVHVKAADRFAAALAGVTDPEQKRKIIGREFIRVFEEAARDLVEGHRESGEGEIEFLVQGTLYPDVIESGLAHRREDQVAPQRRWPAGRPAVRPGRAAADAVQGRGAPGRRGTRAARGDRLAAAVPRARVWPSASSAR